jgi:hypothetical protein
MERGYCTAVKGWTRNPNIMGLNPTDGNKKEKKLGILIVTIN